MEGICWNMNILRCSSPNVCYHIMNLFQMVLQGPILQFVRRSDIYSLEGLSKIIASEPLQNIQSILENPELLLTEEKRHATNSVQLSNVVKAGPFSILELQKTNTDFPIREHIANILDSCKRIAVRFYAFYDRKDVNETAFIYRDRWDVKNSTALGEIFSETYAGQHRQANILQEDFSKRLS